MAVATVCLSALVVVLVIGGMTWLTVSGTNGEGGNYHNTVPIVVNMMLTYFTSITSIGSFATIFSAFIAQIMSWLSFSSKPSARFAAVDCSINPTYYQRYIAINMVILPAAVLAGLASVLAKWKQKYTDKRKWVKRDLLERLRLRKPQSDVEMSRCDTALRG